MSDPLPTASDSKSASSATGSAAALPSSCPASDRVQIPARWPDPETVWSDAGRSTFDRPDVSEVLAELDTPRP